VTKFREGFLAEGASRQRERSASDRDRASVLTFFVRCASSPFAFHSQSPA